MIKKQFNLNLKNKKTYNFKKKVYLKRREKNIVETRISC